mmetsp:Transcript_18620/g.29798  ORF Transcript_18620/g.29798 Transcript_18620/m.29798 type:complete len:255 (+) Transcript_18620:1475-2239(+)
MIPRLLSMIIVRPATRPSSRDSANAMPPSSSISLFDKSINSSVGTSAMMSAIAEAPSSPNTFPLISNDISELPSWTISSARAHAPSPVIEFIARLNCFNRRQPGSTAARAAAPASPTPLLPRCSTLSFLHKGSAGESQVTPGSARKHPRRSSRSSCGVPIGSASASSAPPPGPTSFPLKFKCVSDGVCKKRREVATCASPSAVIALLERSSSKRACGSALTSAATPASPISQFDSVRKVSTLHEASPPAIVIAP